MRPGLATAAPASKGGVAGSPLYRGRVRADDPAGIVVSLAGPGAGTDAPRQALG